MEFTHDELARLIRGFARLYLEVEAGRRPARVLTAYVASGLVPRLRDGRREAVTGQVRVGHVTYTAVGFRVRAVATVYRGNEAGALLLTFRRGAHGGWRLVELEAPDRPLLAEQ